MLNVLLFFIISFVLFFIFRLIHISNLFIFVLVGAIIGAHGLKLFNYNDSLQLLGNIGITFLWFIIGLEINLKRLWQMRLNIFGFGSAQTLLIIAIIMPILFVFTNWSLMCITMIAIILSMSSMTSNLQYLADKNQLNTILGKQIFSILLFQDLLIIPILCMIPTFADITITNFGANIIDVFILAIGLVIGATTFSKFILNPLMKFVVKTKSKEIFLLSIILNILLFVYVFNIIGMPASLGAFISGILLSSTIYRHQVRVDILPYSLLFTSLFFMNIGLELDLNTLKANWYIVVIGLFLFMFIKSLAIYLVAKFKKLSTSNAIFIALVLASGGEFSILILQTLKEYNINAIPIIYNDILITIISISIILSPILVIIYEKLLKTGFIVNKKNVNKNLQNNIISNIPVYILGFGRVGQTIAQMLDYKQIKYMAVDLDINTVLVAKETGYNIFYGNSVDEETLKTFGLHKKTAKVAVLALDNISVAKNTIRAIKNINKKVKIFARAKNIDESSILISEGAKVALPETIESAFVLGKNILQNMNVKENEIDNILKTLRNKNYSKLK